MGSTAGMVVMAESADCSETFPEKLKALLDRRGERGKLSQQALADRLGLTRASVNDWCCGRATPAPDTVFALERVLEIDPGTLSRTLGYLPLSVLEAKAPPTVPEAINRCPRLSDEARRLLLVIYQELASPEQRHGTKKRK